MATLSRIAARARHRVLHLDDLRSLGYSREQVRGFVRHGRLWRVYPGVYALEGALSAEGWAYAATLAARGYASRLTAAALLGYRNHWPSPPSVTIVGRSGSPGPAGIDVHHARHLDTTRSDGIRVTSPAQTIIDCSRLLSVQQLKALLRAAEYRGLDITTLDRPGLPRPLRDQLDRYVLGSGLTTNEIEARFFEIAVAAGLPRPEVQARFPEQRRIDFVWHELRLIVETDGRRGHSGALAFDDDRARERLRSSADVALPDDVRAHCAEIAASARFVTIDETAIPAYAAALEPAPARPPEDPAFALQLNAINFGSGWFPTLRKPSGLSGFRTVEAGLRRHGPYSQAQLAAMDAQTIASHLGQDPHHPLMELFATALRDLVGVAVHGDAVEIAEQLAALPSWHDPGFYKRAQIAAAALAATGVGRLTMFADNLVPHVLKLDGVLRFDPALDARIDRGELLEHGSREEVEIRACAVHAVELMTGPLTAAQIDEALWNRGAQPRYKARPRHRARCTAY